MAVDSLVVRLLCKLSFRSLPVSREVSFEGISADELFPVRVELKRGVSVEEFAEWSVSWAVCSGIIVNGVVFGRIFFPIGLPNELILS